MNKQELKRVQEHKERIKSNIDGIKMDKKSIKKSLEKSEKAKRKIIIGLSWKKLSGRLDKEIAEVKRDKDNR